MWTENWTGWYVRQINEVITDLDPVFILCFLFCRYTEFGGPVPRRSAEDTAFSVARFIQNGGSLVNYYMVGWSIAFMMYLLLNVNRFIGNFY